MRVHVFSYTQATHTGEKEIVIQVACTDKEGNYDEDTYYITKDMLLEVLNSGKEN